jgi:hypothetical protein
MHFDEMMCCHHLWRSADPVLYCLYAIRDRGPPQLQLDYVALPWVTLAASQKMVMAESQQYNI